MSDVIVERRETRKGKKRIMKRQGRSPVQAVEDPELVGRSANGASDATIERLSIATEEQGAGEALTQTLGSLFVATITYMVIKIPSIRS